MDSEALKLATYVAALLVSPAVFIAALRLIFAAGKWAASIDRLVTFAEAATKRLEDHETRITLLEKED